jgi:hypothetical protein
VYLAAALKGCGSGTLRSDNGLWVWLTLYYFDALCPLDRTGKRKVLEIEQYIPSRQCNRKYFRHLVGSAALLVDEFGELAKVLLVTNLGGIRHSDFLNQLGSRQDMIRNRAVIELASILYFDSKTGKIRRGAVHSKKPGNVWRLIAVAQQLELTYDLHAMTADMIGARLPAEFGQWGPGT